MPRVLVSAATERSGPDLSECATHLPEAYQTALLEAGGIPLAMPGAVSRPVIAACVDACDGVLLTGGEDVDPRIYGPKLRPELHNSLSAAHGGVVCTVLDVAMAAAARSDDPSMRVVTGDMSVQFMRPGVGTLMAVGRTTTLTRSLAFCEAEIRDPDGNLVAKGTGVFKRLKPGRGDGDG